jgi:hypothetical protein
MAWLVLDMASPFLSGFLSPPLSLLYGVMEKTVSLAGRVPGLSADKPLLALWPSLGIWLLLLCFAYRRRIAQAGLRPFA